ncbi:MAG: DUF1460 domain-containing protein, partial [Desulfuromonadales bacterium]|nr:DUF1460 domain-containing protein [Desulfuromonadales bacterium]NIS43795.1 DUF1460 domain-containing protein [Desulfuromonadales bacterium]
DDVGGPAVVRTEKQLNQKGAGELYLPGIAVRSTRVSYIPTAAVAETVLAGLASGDYIGIYSTRTGLDVTHVGILVRRDDGLFLRHASNRPGAGKVVDTPLLEYLRDKPGIIVFRARRL